MSEMSEPNTHSLPRSERQPGEASGSRDDHDHNAPGQPHAMHVLAC